MKFHLVIVLSLSATTLLQAQAGKEYASTIAGFRQQATGTTFETCGEMRLSNALPRKHQPDDPQSSKVVRKGNGLYVESSRLKPYEIERLFHREQLYISYKKATRRKNLSWLPICCGAAIAGTVLGFSGHLDKIPVVAGTLAGSACLGAGIWINIANTRRINAIVKEYNAKATGCRLGIAANPHGLGIGLAF